MNFEARLIVLTRLRDEIKAAADIRALTPEGTFDPALFGRVERWAQQIAIAEKDIRSGHHLNALHYGQLRFARDRGVRHAAGQRHKSRAGNLDRLDGLLGEIEEALRRLLLTKGAEKSDAAKALEAIRDSLENIRKAGQPVVAFEGDFGHEQATISSAVQQVQRTVAPGTTILPVIDIFTLILAYFALIKAMQKRK